MMGLILLCRHFPSSASAWIPVRQLQLCPQTMEKEKSRSPCEPQAVPQQGLSGMQHRHLVTCTQKIWIEGNLFFTPRYTGLRSLGSCCLKRVHTGSSPGRPFIPSVSGICEHSGPNPEYLHPLTRDSANNEASTSQTMALFNALSITNKSCWIIWYFPKRIPYLFLTEHWLFLHQQASGVWSWRRSYCVFFTAISPAVQQKLDIFFCLN